LNHITERIWLRYRSPKFPSGKLLIRSKRYMGIAMRLRAIAQAEAHHEDRYTELLKD